jgi:hypothetical protein
MTPPAPFGKARNWEFGLPQSMNGLMVPYFGNVRTLSGMTDQKPASRWQFSPLNYPKGGPIPPGHFILQKRVVSFKPSPRPRRAYRPASNWLAGRWRDSPCATCRRGLPSKISVFFLRRGMEESVCGKDDATPAR